MKIEYYKDNQYSVIGGNGKDRLPVFVGSHDEVLDYMASRVRQIFESDADMMAVLKRLADK